MGEKTDLNQTMRKPLIKKITRTSFRGPGRELDGSMEKSPEPSRQKVIQLLLALFSSMGLSLDLAFHGTGSGAFDIVRNWLGSFPGFQMSCVLLTTGLFLVFRLAEQFRGKQGRWARKLLAAFFALNMVLGFAFEQEGSWELLRGVRNGQLFKAGFVWLSWYLVLENLLVLVFHVLNTARISTGAWEDGATQKTGKSFQPAQQSMMKSEGGSGPTRWYARMLRKHPFGTPFCILLILILPHLYISYPGMFMGDTGSIIVQAYSELETTGTDYLAPANVMKAGVYINQHHPVFYTLLLHSFLVLGDRVFSSLNAGAFLYVLCQTGIMLAAFSYAVSTFVQQRVKAGYCVLILIYVLIHPLIHNYLVLLTKEGLYSACFLLMMSSLFRIRFREKTGSETAVLIGSVLGVILLRNEGGYIILLSGILMAMADRSNRKAILGLTAASLVLFMGIYHGLYIYLGYTPGSIREMLSVPFQQTARYVHDRPKEVTAEEAEAINGVLDYDSLAEKYAPEIADPIKIIFREESTTPDLIRYFRSWAGMLARHPGTYLQATYANYDQYLYPGETRMNYYTYGWMENILDVTNRMIEDLGKGFYLPEWNQKLRTITDSSTEAGVLNFPVFSFLMTPAVYSWCLLTALCWGMGRGIRNHPWFFAQTVPAAVILIILFLGPTNGFYGRYMLPIVEYLPFLLLMLPLLRQREEEMEKRKGDPA